VFLYTNIIINIINAFKLCKPGSVSTHFKKLMQVLKQLVSVVFFVFKLSTNLFVRVHQNIHSTWIHFSAIILPSLSVILQICGKGKLVSKVAWQFRFSDIIFCNTACFKLDHKGTFLLNTSHLKKKKKVRHPRCVYNKLDWSVHTCLTLQCPTLQSSI